MITLAFCIADYFFVMSYKFFKRAVLRISLCAAAFSVFVSASADKRDFDLIKNVEVFNSIVKELNTFYVDSIDADKVIGNGIRAMLYSLDPFTNYIPEERRDDMKFITTGEYAGIGALIGLRDDSLVYISDVYAGNPAYTDGLRVGDVIVAVDGEKVVGRDTEYVSNRLRGKSNTVVKVSVSRPGTEGVITVPVTRKKIYVPAVSYYGVIADGVGYIYLTNFNDKSADEVKAEIEDVIGLPADEAPLISAKEGIGIYISLKGSKSETLILMTSKRYPPRARPAPIELTTMPAVKSLLPFSQ